MDSGRTAALQKSISVPVGSLVEILQTPTTREFAAREINCALDSTGCRLECLEVSASGRNRWEPGSTGFGAKIRISSSGISGAPNRITDAPAGRSLNDRHRATQSAWFGSRSTTNREPSRTVAPKAQSSLSYLGTLAAVPQPYPKPHRVDHSR
jgi:hypothetical protein